MPLFRKLKKIRQPSDIRVAISNSQDLTPEDVFFDVSSPLAGDDEKKLEIPVSSWTTRLFYTTVFASLLFFAAYTIAFIIRHGDEYRLIAEQNAERLNEIGPSRGDIVTQDGTVIASSTSVFDLRLNPHDITQDEVAPFLQELEKLFPALSFEGLAEKIFSAQKQKLGMLVVVKNRTEDEIMRSAKLFERYPALTLQEHPVRFYPEGNLFSHVVGYVAPVTEGERKQKSGYALSDMIGKEGVEAAYEKILRGIKGVFAKFVSARGDVIREEVLQTNQKGGTVELTIDYHLQEVAHRALKDALSKYGVPGGAVVIIDPRSGAVRAMVSLPDYDPNDFVKGLTNKQAALYFKNSSTPLFNRVTSGQYATGSVIKPLIASAALEENIISPAKQIITHGFITVPSVYDPSVVYRFDDWKNHGVVDMRKALAVSSNVYFYTIGGGYQDQKGLGAEKIAEYLHRFNWGKKLGIDFAEEKEGFVPTPEWKQNTKHERWMIGDTYNMSIGQGDILATPLQIAAATSVFANKGTLYRPYVIHKIYPQGGTPRSTDSGDIIQSNIVSQRALNTVRDGMHEAVLTGSSRYLLQLPVSMAGKTGTAQTPGSTPNAWFTGFAPYENSELTITVLLEEGETSNNAVRVAYEILSNYFQKNGSR